MNGDICFFSTNLTSAKHFPRMDPDHIAQLDLHLDTVKKIMQVARGQYLYPRTKRSVNNTLPCRIRYAGAKLQNLYDQVDADFLLGITELLDYIRHHKQEYTLVANRSNLYNVIENLDGTGKWADELKDFVDLCYNEVVAVSLCDNEKDIIATKTGNPNIGIYVRNEDTDYLASGQKYELINNTESDANTLSWEKLKSVLAEAKSLKIDSSNWNTCMEEILSRHEIKSLCLAGKQFVTGSIKFLGTVATKYYTSKQIIEDESLSTLVQMTFIGAEMLDETSSVKAFGKAVKQAGVSLKDAKEYSRMQKYLTQTTYFRRDYATNPEESK